MKKVQIMWNKLKVKLSMFLTPEPEVKDDYIDKVVYLLRRDFESEVQNDVLFAIGKKLSVLREQDLRKMEDDYIRLQKSSTSLNSRIAFQ